MPLAWFAFASGEFHLETGFNIMRNRIPLFALRITSTGLFLLSGAVLWGQPPKLPPNYPPGQYDESKVPQCTLPDPLILLNGKRVTDVRMWKEQRRREILELFTTYVYDHTLVGRPEHMKWEGSSPEGKSADNEAISKTVTIFLAGKKDGPKLDLRLTLPGHTGKPVPVFLMPVPAFLLKRGSGAMEQMLLGRGYGMVTFDPASIEADNANGYATSIRAFFAPPGQKEPCGDEWGAIGTWAWGMSRAMDYLVPDPDIDTHGVCILGVSRYGKVVMWAGAQDERFAIIFSVESGCGGANLVGRQYAETVKSITNFAPYWFDHNFKTYADRVPDLPADWHMMVALMAPRPVYISTAEQDYWGDPRGSSLAAQYADPAYKLFGKVGLGADAMPPAETPVGDRIGYHNRKGTHGLNDYDWQQFLNFADRQYSATKPAE